MDLSIVIINHDTKELTSQTINSVMKTTKTLSYEIIVVDNSDTPSQRYVQDDFCIVLSGMPNKGFGHACNAGARQAAGRYILFLNSDTILHDGALEKCVEYLDSHTDVGALGIRTTLPDGTLDHGCKRGFPTPASALYYYLGFDKRHPESHKYGAYRQTFVDEMQTSEVDAVSGAFMMLPLEAFQKVQGFDEQFFMYGEDLDLCYRIKNLGFRIVYFAQASMTHLKGQSGLHTKSSKIIYHFYHAMILFYKKHYLKKYNFFVTAAVYCGVWLKYWMTLLKASVSR